MRWQWNIVASAKDKQSYGHFYEEMHAKNIEEQHFAGFVRQFDDKLYQKQKLDD